MTRMMPRHDSSTVLDFLGKRGESSAAFFFAFLTPEMTLLDIGCGPGAVTAVLAGRSSERSESTSSPTPSREQGGVRRRPARRRSNSLKPI
jgi:cyclopropane fatty-acyl-phospholipid synthase-like methyltransferase